MKKKCELCRSVASMFCESDQASLCWDCDSRVHGANFLVAKHVRTLLCHACQSPTPWTGSGAKLGPTVSVCDACASRSREGVDGRRRGPRNRNADDEEEEEDDDENGGDDDESSDEEDGDDDGENQVVPLSLPQSLASSSSSTSSEETSSSRRRHGGGSSSSSGFPNATTTSRFSYNVGQSMERSEEETGAQKVRSWKWR